MIKNGKISLFCVLALMIGGFLSLIPQSVFATASGYVCSDGDYDPMVGDNSSPTLYYVEHQHSWGVCKDGKQPILENAVVKNDACNSGFLGFPAWYRGLTNANCDIVSPGSNTGASSGISLSSFIWTVVLNIVEMAMVAVVYVTVFFILYGGFQFLTSQGAPEGMAKARTTITNAIIGLVISLIAIGLINYIVTGLLI